jgi:hypothetical protein
MALPDPKLQQFKTYLKKGFALREDWHSLIFDEVYTYLEIKEALRKLSMSDPDLHRLLGWVWLSNRPRNDVAGGLFMDPSTLKRKQDKAMLIILNYLNNCEVTAELEPIDLINQDEFNK